MSSENNHRQDDDIKARCPIADSELCDWLGKKGCYPCYISTLKSEKQKEDALARWKVTLSYLPENIDDLHMSDECQFCKDKPAEKAEYYATFEMAHPEPYAEKGMILGLGKKMRTPVGSMVMVQASIGAQCKKDLRKTDFLQISTVIIFLIASFVLLAIPQIGSAMANWMVFMPYVFILLMLCAGFFLGKNLSAAHFKKIQKHTKADLTEIPLINQMIHNGWFFFNMGNDGIPKVFFRKTKAYDHIRMPCGPPKDDEDETTLDNINI